MSKLLSAVLLVVLACPAWAEFNQLDPNGERYKLLNCFRKVLVPAQYHVSKKLVKPKERRYVKRNGIIELREYPAVYQEIRRKVKDEYFVMQEVHCIRKKKSR